MEFTKKGNLFQTFLLLMKKNSKPLLNPIETCFIPCFFLFIPATNSKYWLSSLPQIWQPLPFPVWIILLFFLGEEITSSVVVVRVVTIIVLDDGLGSLSGSITE